MSVLGYGMRVREAVAGEGGVGVAAAEGGAEGSESSLKAFVDILAALIPAELIAAHGAILGFGTETIADPEGTTRIANPDALRFFFFVLLITGPALYIIGRGRNDWGRADVIRLLIPAVAFVGWTMLQRPSMWDAVEPNTPDVWRYGIPIAGSIVLGAIVARVNTPAPGSA